MFRRRTDRSNWVIGPIGREGNNKSAKKQNLSKSPARNFLTFSEETFPLASFFPASRSCTIPPKCRQDKHNQASLQISDAHENPWGGRQYRHLRYCKNAMFSRATEKRNTSDVMCHHPERLVWSARLHLFMSNRYLVPTPKDCQNWE
jgi:hypothetical protein